MRWGGKATSLLKVFLNLDVGMLAKLLDVRIFCIEVLECKAS